MQDIERKREVAKMKREVNQRGIKEKKYLQIKSKTIKTWQYEHIK